MQGQRAGEEREQRVEAKESAVENPNSILKTDLPKTTSKKSKSQNKDPSGSDHQPAPGFFRDGRSVCRRVCLLLLLLEALLKFVCRPPTTTSFQLQC
jgi:hypothetical protein